MDILRPSFESLPDGDDATRVRQLEKDSVVTSLENLMTFPHVSAAVEAGRLSLHGLWTDIGNGGLEAYNGETGEFFPV
jgi:carbonic anhydrase